MVVFKEIIVILRRSKDMLSGEVVKVTATDQAAHLDFGVYAEQTGNEIIEYIKAGEQQIFYVRKK
jgi:tRNA 2-thiouridine synthesizing protein A